MEVENRDRIDEHKSPPSSLMEYAEPPSSMSKVSIFDCYVGKERALGFKQGENFRTYLTVRQEGQNSIFEQIK